MTEVRFRRENFNVLYETSYVLTFIFGGMNYEKALKICAGIAVIGYVAVKAFAVGEAMTMTWSLYKGDYERANACAAGIKALHGQNSEWTNAILYYTETAVNTMLKLDGNQRRVKHE